MATSFVFDRPVRFPEMCQCGAQGIDPNINPAYQVYQVFVQAIQAIVAHEKPGQTPAPGGDLQLEFVVGGGA
jgi:hypothetical protein